MSTYLRILQFIHIPQNVSALKKAQRDIEKMAKEQQCQTSSNS